MTVESRGSTPVSKGSIEHEGKSIPVSNALLRSIITVPTILPLYVDWQFPVINCFQYDILSIVEGAET